jgi:hypothetical protein
VTADKIKTGIAAYSREQAVILRVLRKHGELSEHEFDRIFGDFKRVLRPDGVTEMRHRRMKVRFCPFNPESFILGGLGQGEWARWLDLTQMMALCSLVETFAKGRTLYYRATS